MPGCLLLHVGIDLSREALWDSLKGFDVYEYAVIITLTIIMTLFGMTTGLLLGVGLSALTFVMQTSSYVKPIRRKLRASTLKSTKWRTPLVRRELSSLLGHVLVIQLQGNLFFANSTALAEELESILESDRRDGDRERTGWVEGGRGEESKEESFTRTWREIKLVLLDFTLVLGIDSSAAGLHTHTCVHISRTSHTSHTHS